MTTSRALLLAALAFAIPAAVPTLAQAAEAQPQAQAKPAQPQTAQDCASKNTQFEMTGCARLGHKQADAALNRVYRDLLKKLTDADAKNLLRDSERAWVAYRDKQCAFESSGAKGGTVQPMVLANCQWGLTDLRIKELERQASCPEGDVSCAR